MFCHNIHICMYILLYEFVHASLEHEHFQMICHKTGICMACLLHEFVYGSLDHNDFQIHCHITRICVVSLISVCLCACFSKLRSCKCFAAEVAYVRLFSRVDSSCVASQFGNCFKFSSTNFAFEWLFIFIATELALV